MSNRLAIAIAWWQMMCGVAGIATFGALYFGLFEQSEAVLRMLGPINYWAGVGFFAFAIRAGRELLKPWSPWGLKASAVCQALQIVSFSFLNGPVVRIQAGPRVAINLSSSFVGIDIGFSSSFFIGTRVAGPAFDITINVLAAVWSAILIREWLRTSHIASAAAA